HRHLARHPHPDHHPHPTSHRLLHLSVRSVTSEMGNLPWISVADGLVVTVRLTPKGGRDAIDGVGMLADGRNVLQARVRAAPSEGEANAALLRLLAKKLGLAARDVRLEAGA